MVRRPRSAHLGDLLVLSLLLSPALPGCGDRASEGLALDVPREAAPAELLIFVFDRSASIHDHELRHALDLTRTRVGALSHGDRIVAIELLEQSLDEEPRRWSQRVPDRQFPDLQAPRDSVARERFLRDVRDYLVGFADPANREKIQGTDILSTLHLVSAELRADPGARATLVLYSDMLQANRVMNMEGLVRMPPEGWIAGEAARGALPNLPGLCVVVAGVRKDTVPSQAARAFWAEYFDATEAILLEENYSYRPVRLPERPCAGA